MEKTISKPKTGTRESQLADMRDAKIKQRKDRKPPATAKAADDTGSAAAGETRKAEAFAADAKQESETMRSSTATKTKTTRKTRTATTSRKTKSAKSKAMSNARTAADNLRPDGLRKGSAGGKLVDMVCRKQGATNEELCKAVGWKQCLPMLRKSCDQAKVKLTTERPEGELTRYYGKAK